MLNTATPYQSQYLAWLLSRRMGVDSAALFAFHSPLSKGVILADEVGLGKTIEAGLVIAQRWAERKRHITMQWCLD